MRRLPPTPGRYTNLRLSPDGTMVAAEMIEVDAAGIWVIDLTRGGRTRLTSDGEDNHFPIWTSGGEEVAFCTAGDGEILLRSAPADGSPGTYHWCQCGESSNQPFCDGSHAGTGFTPMMVEITEKKTVALCQCKQTNNAPMCDGSHSSL